MKRILTLTLLGFILTGCSHNFDEEAHEIFNEEPQFEKIHLFTQSKEHLFSPIESVSGVHLGAFLNFDANPVTDHILEFEDMVGIQHSIYTYEMMLGEKPSTLWLLEMLSEGRIPNIIVTHGNLLDPFDKTRIRELAEELGQYHLPILLQLLPEPRYHHYNSGKYIEFIQYAREIFREYAPKVSFVFSISEEDILDSMAFYPGDDVIDWLGINLFLPIVENGPFDDHYLKRLDAFYFSFSNKKPILVTIGVSHFTTTDHSYHLHDAGATLKSFYSTVLNTYPRVRAIVYNDLNSVLRPTTRHRHDNFSITSNQGVLDYYKEAISDHRFVDISNFSATDNTGTLFLRSPFSGVRMNNTILIPKHALVYDLALNSEEIEQLLSDYEEDIDGHLFYAIDVIKNIGIFAQIENGTNSVVFG